MGDPEFKLRPMLACETPETEAEREKLRWPMLGSPKLDGIRALVRGGVVLSRNLKPIPSAFVQKQWGDPLFEGFDGELIVPSLSYRETMSAVMTHGSQVPVRYYVFDNWAESSLKYLIRLEQLKMAFDTCGTEDFRLLPQLSLADWGEVERLEERALSSGFEGLILRDPQAEYKFGRSTLREQCLVKVKRWKDGEAFITGVVELERNQNEAVVDNLGYTRRSTSQNGKTGGATLGALTVADVKTGVLFNIGTGFDMATRDSLWARRESLIGRTVKFKFREYGGYDAPRHPVFAGFRDPIDM